MMKEITIALSKTFAKHPESKGTLTDIFEKLTGKRHLQNQITGLQNQIKHERANQNRTRRENIMFRHVLNQIVQHDKNSLAKRHIDYWHPQPVHTTALLLATVALISEKEARHKLVKKAPKEYKHQARDAVLRAIFVKTGLTIEKAEQKVYRLRGKSLARHKQSSYN